MLITILVGLMLASNLITVALGVRTLRNYRSIARSCEKVADLGLTGKDDVK